MHDSNDTWNILFKTAMAWGGAIYGSVTLSKLVLFATFVYTILQTYVLWRDKLKKGGSGEL